MMIYVVLNTMIWLVVYLSKGQITPSNWQEKEVYNWGMARRDVPAWMRAVKKTIARKRKEQASKKDVVELVDNDSAILAHAPHSDPADLTARGQHQHDARTLE